MVVLEKRETRQISFFVRGLKAGGPVDSSNLVNERVNYDEVTSVDLASTPQGFQIRVLTDRIEVKFFVHEDWRAQDAVDSLDAKLISSIDTERLGAVWIEYREQPTRFWIPRFRSSIVIRVALDFWAARWFVWCPEFASRWVACSFWGITKKRSILGEIWLKMGYISPTLNLDFPRFSQKLLKWLTVKSMLVSI
jgi:hypothetical protein